MENKKEAGMSDSDDGDNAYTDYLESRRAALLKKKRPQKVYPSDSDGSDDDDFTFTTRRSDLKRRKDDEDDEEDESLLEEDVVESHDQQLKNKIDEMKEEYRRALFSRGSSVVPCTSEMPETVLTKTMKMCEDLSYVTKECASAITISSDIDVVEDFETTLLDEIPVTVSVLDCEVTKEIKRHELQSTSTFEEIRRQYANLWKCGLASVIITHKGETVPKDCTPKDLGFRPMQIPNPKLEIYRKSDTENGGGLNGGIITVESTPDYFIVKAQFKNRKKPVLIKVQDETTVGKIKELILEQLEEEKEPEIPRIEAMRVIFDDEYLTDDSATCQDIGIENEDCLDIHVQ